MLVHGSLRCWVQYASIQASADMPASTGAVQALTRIPLPAVVLKASAPLVSQSAALSMVQSWPAGTTVQSGGWARPKP